MGFRDDTEALRARATSLEKELSDTQAELEEAKKKLAERASKRRTARARALFEATRGWLVRHKVALASLLVTVVLAGAVVFVWQTLSSSSPDDPLPAILFSEEGYVTEAHGVTGVVAGDDCHVWIEPNDGDHNCRVHVTCAENELYGGWTFCGIVAGEAVSANDTEYGADGDAALRFDRDASLVVLEDASWSVNISLGPRPMRRSERVSWIGVVERTLGSDVSLDSPCTLAALVAGDGYRLDVTEVTVRCGETQLYRSAPDAPAKEWSILEGPAPAPGSYEYVLQYEDRGGEPARTLASIDTSQRRARVWRDESPPMFVELRIDDVSAPRQSEPFVGANQDKRAVFRETIDAPARVSAAETSAPVAVDETCRFRLRPTWSTQDHNCRVSVHCGRHFLYGGGDGGYVSCAIIDGVPVSATSGGDELFGIRYQRATGTVSLRSFDVAQPWVVELELVAPARHD